MSNQQMPQFADDYFRMTGQEWNREGFLRRFFRLLNSHALRYLKAYRNVQTGKDPLGFYRFMLRRLEKKYGLALGSSSIGKGLYLGHPYNITVCKYAVIGENCNLNKGCSILPENDDNRSTAPVIGSRVWIGVNVVVIGNVTIGDNVLIAPNAYVNFDVPSDSIVIGNPAKILNERSDAVEGYIHYVC